jgi:succinoglycan biosynthesis protein ExoM
MANMESLVGEAVRVAVCACTCRRADGLRALLEGLGEQRFTRMPAPAILVFVADNEGSREAATICADAAEMHGLRLHYLVEPRRGISYARNRCLDSVPADVESIAMIDDDERPDPDWLEELLLVQRETGADVVQGRVYPEFSAASPDWIRRGDFFGYPTPASPFRPQIWTDRQDLPSAATNNVLVRTAAINALALRFDLRLALAGGEDALFFRMLKAAGQRIVYAAEAVVHEEVPADRARLGYLLRRAYRNGSKRLAAKLWRKPGARRIRLRLAARALKQALDAFLWLIAQVLRGRTDAALLAHGLIEIAAAAGTLAACAGLRYEHYRRA